MGIENTSINEKQSKTVRMTVNGESCEFVVGVDLDESETLAHFLREHLGLTGLKVACDEGACGACTVIMDGRAVFSCMSLAIEADGHEILTVESLKLDDPLVQAFADQSEPGYGTAMQCGYCTPGFVMNAKVLLKNNPEPTTNEIKESISGHICRCGCYSAIEKAIQHAAEKCRGGENL